MYISGLGATAGGFDYTAAARAVASTLLPYGPEMYAVVRMGPEGYLAKGFVFRRELAFSGFAELEKKVGVGAFAYVAILSNKAVVMDEKLDPTVGQRPIDPYATPLPLPTPSTPPVAVTTPAQVEAVLPPPTTTFAARRAGSMMTWLLLGVGAVGLAFYAKQRRVA